MHAEDWRFNLLYAVLLTVHYWWVTLPLLALGGYGMWRIVSTKRKPQCQ
jgi:hypothetical protein